MRNTDRTEIEREFSEREKRKNRTGRHRDERGVASRPSGSARNESANKLISLADNQAGLSRSNNGIRRARRLRNVSSNWCQERERRERVGGETRLSNRLTGCNAFQPVKIIAEHRLRKGSPLAYVYIYARRPIANKDILLPSGITLTTRGTRREKKKII